MCVSLLFVLQWLANNFDEIHFDFPLHREMIFSATIGTYSRPCSQKHSWNKLPLSKPIWSRQREKSNRTSLTTMIINIFIDGARFSLSCRKSLCVDIIRSMVKYVIDNWYEMGPLWRYFDVFGDRYLRSILLLKNFNKAQINRSTSLSCAKKSIQTLSEKRSINVWLKKKWAFLTDWHIF